jgi:hypothetical protein
MTVAPSAVRVKKASGWQDIAIVGPPGPPGAMTLLSEQVLSADGQFAFTNIPQTYKHLELRIRARGSVTGLGGCTGVGMRLNSLVGGWYNTERHSALGGSAQADFRQNQTMFDVGQMPDNSGDANGWGYARVEIPNYRDAVGYQIFQSEAINGDATNMRRWNNGGLIWNLTVPVTRIDLFSEHTSGNNFKAGSYAALYGIGPNVAGSPVSQDIYCQVPQGQNPITSCANGLWTQVLIPAVGASFVISKSDGITDDFTRNADGSVTINRAGNYHIEAVASEIAAAWPDATSINFGLAKANGRLPTTSDWLVVGEYTAGSATNNYPSCPVSCDILCAVGDRIAGWLWHNSGAARNIALRNFSITKTGAGPTGPKGPAGGGFRVSDMELAKGFYTGNNIAVTATTHAASQEIVTLPPITVDGATRLRAEISIALAVAPVGGSGHALCFGLYTMTGGTPGFNILFAALQALFDGSTNFGVPVFGVYEWTPPAGTYTYSLRSYVSTGSGNIVGSQSGYAQPSFRILRS